MIFHSYTNVYQRVKFMIELILIGGKLSACDSVIPHSNGNSQPRWSKSYWFLLCIHVYIYTHIYICIGYILYTLYLPTQTVKCVLYIYLYLHIISSNGRPKYNIMYVCIYIYILLLYIYIYIYSTYVLNYTRQHADVCVFTCTHSFTLLVLHCWHHITLHDITWHHMSLRYITYTLHACMYILLYIYTQIHALNELYPAAPGSMLPMTSIC